MSTAMRHAMRPKVLVIDTNENDARSFADVLGAASVDIETDSDAGVARLGRGERYDLVVCDLAARGELSAQFAGALRKLDGRGTLFAVISDDPQEAEAYSDAGVCVLSPPVRSADLRALLDAATRNGRS